MRDNDVICEALQRALNEERELTAEECAHLEECETCLDASLTAMLNAKPAVEIPAEFAARVVAAVPAKSAARTRWPRHAGLITAMAVVAVLLAVCFAAPKPANNWIGIFFMLLVATEVAGIALWLAPKHSGW
jgi:CHASE2 domain-containing sensor protein